MSAPAILIVSAATGSGHTRAAEAVRAALRAQDPSVPVEHVELLGLAPRWVRAAYGDAYELVAKRAPWLWGQVYRRTDAPDADHARWGPLAQRLLFRAFRDLLLSRPWSVCLSTHFLPGQLAAGSPGLPPFALVVTDLTLHHYWAQPRVRRYFVAHEGLGRDLAARVPGARVQATGIPVAPCFGEAPTRARARAALGLDSRRRIVLVVGGGLGIGVEAAARAALEANVEGGLVVAVCGRNAAAAERLRRLAEAGDGRLLVRGFVADIERYFAAADLVVTKPGGLTTSEVLAVGRPLLLTGALPGQEEGNTRILCAAGVAVEAPSLGALAAAIRRLLGEPRALARLETAARAFGRPTAAGEVAGSVRREYAGRAAA